MIDVEHVPGHPGVVSASVASDERVGARRRTDQYVNALFVPDGARDTAHFDSGGVLDPPAADTREPR